MATIFPRRNSNGIITSYTIRVLIGKDMNGTKIFETTSYKVPSGMNEDKSKKEAHKQAILFEQQIKGGTASNTRKRFDDYCNYVIDLKETAGAKNSTIERYRGLTPRIFKAIGYLKLKDIKAEHLNRFYMQLLNEDRNIKTGKSLSPTTVRHYHELISVVLGQAYKEDLVLGNVALKATLPKRETKEAEIFNKEELATILKCAQDVPIKWKTIIITLLCTGLRRGELIGLTWNNVDFAKGRVFIDKAVNQSRKLGLYADSPKTKSSVRYVQLPPSAMNQLKEYQLWQKTNRIRLGEYYHNQDYVFTQENGNPISPDSVTKYLTKDFSKKCGFHVNPHKFRHTQASTLIGAGKDIPSVSKRLGHSQISTTLNMYTHVLENADVHNAEVLENLIFAESSAS